MSDAAPSALAPDQAVNGGTFRLPVDDGVELFVHRWLPSGAPRAVVLIAHGMSEHGGRYARTAGRLVAEGYAVYAVDHRGHGQSAPAPGDLGYFADAHGWRRAVDDLYALRRHVGQEHAATPVFLLGHSMGSMMVQQYLFSHGDSIAGALLSGAGGGRALLAVAGMGVAWAERKRLGQRGRSRLLQALSFGDFNRKFRPVRTEYDWLTRDADEVDRYLADPLCGFSMTVQGWLDVLGGTLEIERAANVRRIPALLPIYVFGGELDPVARQGGGVRRLLAALRSAGIRDVTHRLYPHGRHEMLNETNRDEVERDLIAWLDSALQRGRPA